DDARTTVEGLIGEERIHALQDARWAADRHSRPCSGPSGWVSDTDDAGPAAAATDPASPSVRIRVRRREPVHRAGARRTPPGRGDPTVSRPEHDEFAAGLIAPDDDLVGGAAVADVFHTEVELIGVEVRLPVVGLRAAGDRRRRDFGLSDGVVPVLDAQTLIAQ